MNMTHNHDLLATDDKPKLAKSTYSYQDIFNEHSLRYRSQMKRIYASKRGHQRLW